MSLGFYGGEPLLEFALIKTLVAYAEKAFEGKECHFTITTNGSLLNDEMCAFFLEHDFNVMISMDGTPEMHDKSRKFAHSGGGTYATVERNVRRIKTNFPALYKKMGYSIVIDPSNSCEVFPILNLYEDSDVDRLFDLMIRKLSDENVRIMV